MTISRGQMPRQLYGLGGLLKSITKGVKSAVKGVANTVKKNPLLGLAALNFAPMLAGGKPFLGLGGFSLPEFLTSGGQGKSMLKVGATGGLLTGLLAQAEQGDENALALTRNIPALKGYLFENYKNLGYTDDQAQQLTDKDTAEYTQDMARGQMANGGRMGFAYGDTAEQNAMQASGIMGLPMNENPAGVKELDLRETGGFIPPVGVKEKADDIPAMLSNNEFVFTADAVRGMGDGNVNVGAQRMYDMMKKLENGGRV